MKHKASISIDHQHQSPITMSSGSTGSSTSCRVGIPPPLPVKIVKVVLLSFIIVNVFIGGGGGGHSSLAPLSTTKSHAFANALVSVPYTITNSNYLELRRKYRHATILRVGKMPTATAISLGLRRQRHQQPPRAHPAAPTSPSSRSGFHLTPILTISCTCLLLFQQQSALAISSLSNIINSSSGTSILGAATSTATTTAATATSTATATPSYHLTRILFLRLLAIVYTTAFSIAKFQNVGLIGDNGIVPARNILNECDYRAMEKSKRRHKWIEEQRQQYTSTNKGFFQRWRNFFIGGPLDKFLRDKFLHRTDKMDRPVLSLLWLAPNRNKLNPWLTNLANIGIFFSSIMLCTGSANVFLLLVLWIIQRSFMAVGGEFYGYGWEMQLAELTFLSMFLVPMVSMNPFFGPGGVGSSNTAMTSYPVPILALWSIRWYLFKIMMGAGLIKLKSSDMKWKLGNMSAMDYFYETQVSNPSLQRE